jgi:hypothetical protein
MILAAQQTAYAASFRPRCDVDDTRSSANQHLDGLMELFSGIHLR